MADATKPECKYGVNCYQRNEAHKNRFSHSSKTIETPTTTTTAKIDSNGDDDSEKNGAQQKQNTSKRATSPSPNHRQTNEITKKFKIFQSPANGNSSRNSKDISADSTTVSKSPSRTEASSQMNVQENASNVRETESSSDQSLSSAEKVDTLSDEQCTSACNISNEDTSAAVKRENHGPDQKHDIDYINDTFDKCSQFSQRGEYKKLLESPARFIKEKFLVEMPSDFYTFWEFCCIEQEKIKGSALNAQCLFDRFGLNLVGPFDVLAGKFNDADLFEPGDYLRHWRFYYDPPEFQTILKKDKSGCHYGYWRDEPNGTCLIARNDATQNCEFTFVADNIFGAVLHFLENEIQTTPFNRAAVLAIRKSLEQFAHNRRISLTSFSAHLKARNVNTVCKTFHKAGLVVPYDRKTDVGYRQLNESNANLRKILDLFTAAKSDRELISAAMDKLQPLLTAADIACDECDFGNSIELGIDLFCYGAPELHSIALQLLANGYSMVNKPQFIAILKAHLEKRTKGIAPSILN